MPSYTGDGARGAVESWSAEARNEVLLVAETVDIGTTQVPLLGSSNIWVEDSLAGSASLRLTQTVIQKALEGTAPGQLEVIVFDDALSGLAAPFAPLNAGGEKVLHILHDEQDFNSTLRYLRDHVQAVKSMMRGEKPSLVDFRRQIDYPVEGYKLVVVSTDISFLDDASQTQLGILLKAGPAAGVSFLIHSMTLGANPFTVALCDHLTVKPPGVIDRAGEDVIRGWLPPSPQQLVATSEKVADKIARTEMPKVPLADAENGRPRWHKTSKDGVTFTIGRYGQEMIEITLGDEVNQRHNVLVTGAVGQGKSNLISVIIHSLCQRYSPREVELYLLDFKEGVSLKGFYDQADGSNLPHARVIGPDADREFGHSVLKKLHEVYRDRMAVFKKAGVQDIRSYRNENPDVMPRIVVVIDEFQMMFDESDKTSDEIARLLVRGMRLFRACGIHVILASQTIGGNTALMGAAGEGLFAQVPVRLALKNSPAESRATLGDRNEAAAHLRARQAIVNEDYGELSANKKTAIAFADKAKLPGLRTGWWREWRGEPPYVFKGEEPQSLLSNVKDVELLQQRRGQGGPSLVLGLPIKVDAKPLEVPFGRDVGRNVALLGSGEAIAVVQNLALALAVQAPGTQFVVLDFLEDADVSNADQPELRHLLTRLGAAVQVVRGPGVPGFLADLAHGLADRRDPADLVVIGLGMDRCRAMPLEFQDLIKLGPTAGVHVIGWWRKMTSFREHAGYGGESFFDTRLALGLDAQSAKELMADPLLEWRHRHNRMLVWDSAELAEPVPVIPYTIVDDRIVEALGRER